MTKKTNDKYLSKFDNEISEEKNIKTDKEFEPFQTELDNHEKKQNDADTSLINMLRNQKNKNEEEPAFKDEEKEVPVSISKDETTSDIKPSAIEQDVQDLYQPIEKEDITNQIDDTNETSDIDNNISNDISTDIDDYINTYTNTENEIMVENKTNAKNNRNKDYKISNDVLKIGMLILSGVVLVLSIWIMFKSFSPQQEYSTPVLSYNVNNGVKYKVYLNDNDFYETPYLGMNELVPTPFIKYIEIDFSSALQTQQKLNYNYTYKVTGEVKATYTGGEEDKKGTIWTKKYTFVNPVSKTEEDSSNVNMTQKVRINYNVFNTLVNKYKLKASIPMEAFLTVNFTANVNADIKDSNKNLNENIVSSVKIPLSVATVQISTENNGGGSKVISNTEKVEASKNYVLLIFSFALFLASSAVTVKLLIDLKKMTENHSVLFKLNKILKDHDQVVVEIDSVPTVKHATIIEVKQFKDMIDIQQELHLPILYYKTEEVTQNSFYIIHNNQIYKYVINAEMEQI